MKGDNIMKDMEWKGYGYCQGRHINASNDWCNQEVVKGGEYCSHCTCMVKGCRRKAIQWFPLMTPEQIYCREHQREEAT